VSPAARKAPAKRAPAKRAPAKRARAAGVPPVLRALLAARGPSGYESAPAAVWRSAAGAFQFPVF